MEGFNENELGSIGFVPTQLEDTTEGDEEAHFMKDSTSHWFKNSEDVLSKADLTPLKDLNLRELKVSLVDGTMSCLTCSSYFMPVEEHLFKPSILQIKHGPVSQSSFHIAA